MSVVRKVIFDIIGRDNASRAFLKASAAAEKAATSTERAAYKMQAAGAKTQAVGHAMTKNFTLPMVALGAAAVVQSAKFEKSLNTIRVATGQTSADMDKFRSGIKAMAVETGTSFNQLSEGAYIAAKTFHRPAEALHVLGIAAKGAKAENVDLHVAVNALTSVMASYGIKASGALAVQNQLIRAAGLSKTTMQDFAGSLSTVVPLAGALHISFAEVAGAIATMTQHGETAQQSTDNLRNLITNLAGQNNIASQAMQQLGIDTIDLQKHLGDRGLSGTLLHVLGVLKAHGKDGMVVFDSFKHAALGTESLTTMMKKMGPAAKAQSEALVKNKTSLGDYRAFAKSIGGVQGNMAMQFLSAFRSVTGFNNLLKSGRGNQQTYAKALQTVFGGVTGLGAALKLLGPEFLTNANSAHLWTGNIAAIAKAAGEGKGQVLGWADTQKQLATQFDIAKQKGEAFLIGLGEKLAPIASSVIDWVKKIIDFASKATGAFGSTFLKIALVAAAFGPIISLAGRFLKLLGLIRLAGASMLAVRAGAMGVASGLAMSNTQAWKFGNGMRQMFLGLPKAAQIAMRGVGLALAGVGSGYLASSAMPNNKGGLLGSILLGGAAGFTLSGGNPIAGAIGAVSGAIFKGIDLWRHHGDAAKKAMKEELALIKDLTGAIELDNGAIGDNMRLNVNKKLFDKGVYNNTNTLNNDLAAADVPNVHQGISTNEVLDAATGKSKAGFIRFAQSFGAEVRSQLGLSVKEFSKGYGNSFDKLIKDFAKVDPKFLNPYQKTLQQVAKDYAKVANVVGDTSDAADAATAAWREQFTALNQGRTVYGGYGDRVRELRKNLVTAENTNGSFITSLKGSGLAAEHNRAALRGVAASAKEEAVKVAKAALAHGTMSTALKVGRASLAAHSKEILAAAVAAGFGRKQAKEFLDGLLTLGKTDVKPKVNLDDGAARTEMQSLHDWFMSLTWVAHVSSDGSVSAGPGTNRGIARATGGWVNGPGSSTSDSIPAMLSDGEFVVNAKQASRYRRLLERLNRGGALHLAKGGTAKQQAGYDRLTAQISNIGTKPSNPINLADTGYSLVGKQIRQAWIALSKLSLPKATEDRLRKQLWHLSGLIQKQLRNLRIQINHADLNAIHKAIAGSAQDGRDAFRQLLHDMKAVGANAWTVVGARKLETKFLTEQNKLVKERTRLEKVRDYSTSVRDTLGGTFQSGEYGSVEDLLAGLSGQTTQNNTYASDVNGLRARAKKMKGGGTLLRLINQLAAQGQTATLQTLAGSSGAELAQVTSAYGRYGSSLTAGANAATRAQYDTTASAEDALVKRMEAKQDRLIDALHDLTRAMSKHETKVSIDGHHLRHKVIRPELAGAMDELALLAHHGRFS